MAESSASPSPAVAQRRPSSAGNLDLGAVRRRRNSSHFLGNAEGDGGAGGPGPGRQQLKNGRNRTAKDILFSSKLALEVDEMLHRDFPKYLYSLEIGDEWYRATPRRAERTQTKI